ncbi:hypothetical protein N3K66_009004 [Trichothecium roseum]|uniref:Uncharacterized protein n=1 Tax=Trichothecium roseum TaxID=47278 RepID=A0ACC0UPR6_9HYPO|nr:hypothetical protein N3K66_009004 [Trichothecium roseum]
MSETTDRTRLPPWDLPPGVTSRFITTSPRGLRIHALESIPTTTKDIRPPLVLLLHGFPNLSYDWRHIMLRLSEAGFYAVAPDLRGSGRTHNADGMPFDRSTFRPLTLVRDSLALVHALGYDRVDCLVGHDVGAFAASLFALVRPDSVRSLVLMSHPFGGTPKIPFGHESPAQFLPCSPRPETRFERLRDPDIHTSLAKLNPPRVAYKWYNATSQAADEWSHPTGQPLRDFLRGYFHLKSGDHHPAADEAPPRPLRSWTADELAIMPHYYVMRAGVSMRANVALDMAREPPEVHQTLPQTPWLPDKDLEVYAREFERTTFRESLMWYGALTNPGLLRELDMFAGRRLAMPTKYVAGARDWGTHQVPGAMEAMEEGRSVQEGMFVGKVLVDGAGHWINLERPDDCAAEIIGLARSVQ